MSSIKTFVKKIRLSKRRRQTRWAPFWIIPKIYRIGRRVHPGRHTAIKRSWRRDRIKA